MRQAISPRLAMSTDLNMWARVGRPNISVLVGMPLGPVDAWAALEERWRVYRRQPGHWLSPPGLSAEEALHS